VTRVTATYRPEEDDRSPWPREIVRWGTSEDGTPVGFVIGRTGLVRADSYSNFSGYLEVDSYVFIPAQPGWWHIRSLKEPTAAGHATWINPITAWRIESFEGFSCAGLTAGGEEVIKDDGDGYFLYDPTDKTLAAYHDQVAKDEAYWAAQAAQAARSKT
jgi:hypothetical protein